MANAPTLTINVRPAQHSPPSRESDGSVKTADPDVEATVCRCCPAPTQTPDERLANWQHHIPERSTFSSFDLIGLFFLQPALIALSALDIGFSVQVIDTLLPDSSFGGLIEKASSTKPVTGEPGIPNEVIILQLCVALAVLVLLFNIGIWVVTIDTWWVDCNFEHLDDSELARKKGNGYLSCFSYWLAHWWLAKLSCLCCCLPSCVWLLIEIVLQVLFRFSDRIASAVSWACSFLNVAQILVYACILNKLLYYDLWCVGASGNPLERLGEKLYLTGYGGLPTASPSPSPSPFPPPSPLPFPPTSPSPSPFLSPSSSSNSSSTAPLNTGRRHLLATPPPPPSKSPTPVSPFPSPPPPSPPSPSFAPQQATAKSPACAESDLPAQMSRAILLAMVMAVSGTVIFLVGQIRGLGNIVVAGLLFTALTILVLIKSLAASFIFIQVHRLNTVLGNFRMDGPLGLCIANLMFSYVIAGATILWTGFVFNVVGRFVQRFCDMSECGLTAMLIKPSAPDANTLAKMRYRVQEETGVHGEKLVYLVDWHYVVEGGQAMGKVTPGDIPVTQHADANADVVQGAQKAARIAIVVMALGWLGLCIISSSLCLANFAKVSSLTLDPASRGWLEYDRATSVIVLLGSCMLYPVYVYYTMQD